MLRPFDYDPDTGLTTHFRGDGQGGFDLVTTQDCEPELEHNKALQRTGNAAWKAGGDFRLEGHVPDIIVLKWLNEDGIRFWEKEDHPRLIRKLNDPDWRYLKTFDGTI